MHIQMTLDLGIEERVDVRSLIVHGDIEREAPKAKREQPAPEFERVLADGADCAFRRRCGNRSQMLVLLVTQGQYYVTDERTGSRHELTTARLGSFCKGPTGDALTPPWSRQPLQAYDSKGRDEAAAECFRDRLYVSRFVESMGRDVTCDLLRGYLDKSAEHPRGGTADFLPPSRVRPALHGVARHRLRPPPSLRVRPLPARPAPPHAFPQRAAVGRRHRHAAAY